MIAVGVDPGKAGALAVLEADGRVRQVLPMPLVPAGKKGRDEYDLAVIRDLLLVWRHEQAFVTVEKLQPMPLMKGGTIANYNRGVAAGWAWMLEGLKIPYHLVSPQAWQKVMLLGTPGEDTKQRSVLAAHRLFPDVSLRRSARCRVDDNGYSDALLLAEYGRRALAGNTAALEEIRRERALSAEARRA